MNNAHDNNTLTDDLFLAGYSPIRLVGDYTAHHIPTLVNKITVFNIIMLTSVLFIPNALAPIMAKKRIFMPFVMVMCYLMIAFLIDRKNAFMILEYQCPIQSFDTCAADDVTKVKNQKMRYKMQRDIFLCLSGLLSTILLVTVAYFKDKVMRLNA